MTRGTGQGAPIFQNYLPHTPWNDPALSRMPGMRPVEGSWIVVDDAYASQMSERARLMRGHQSAIWAELPAADVALAELLDVVLETLPAPFVRNADRVTCPDGRVVEIAGHPFTILNQLVQEDFLLLDRATQTSEHVLIAGLLCFPAYWTLSEKIGRPLTRVHDPVPEYDADVAMRVQRLFDRVPPGRAMWRANVLPHCDATLHCPKPQTVSPPEDNTTRYIRSERQTVLRLPRSRVMVFAVHTWVVPIATLTPEQRANCPVT